VYRFPAIQTNIKEIDIFIQQTNDLEAMSNRCIVDNLGYDKTDNLSNLIRKFPNITPDLFKNYLKGTKL
jgi:hypothetical protein